MIDLEKLEELPFRESRSAYLTRKYGDMWDLKHFDSLNAKATEAYVIAKRIIKKYLGQHVNEAYKAYCKLVSIPYRGSFDFHLNLEKYRFYSGEFYWVNDEGIICKTNRRKRKRVRFFSADFLAIYPEPFYREHFITIKGFTKTFESKKDKIYCRLRWEKRDALRKQNRQDKQNKQRISDIKLMKSLTKQSKDVK